MTDPLLPISPDQRLTDHFSLYELTKTSVTKFQEQNRRLTLDQISKLTVLARLLEHIRYIVDSPLMITSGYRCPELNTAIGSTSRSQHLLCEAADFVVPGQDLTKVFKLIWSDIKDKRSNVGQLIFETADRPYGVISWIHVSLGTPYRPSEKCAQILRMNDGKYSVVA